MSEEMLRPEFKKVNISKPIGSTLTAIIFLNYGVAAKMALEILGYAMWAGGGGAIFLGNPR